MPKLNAERAKQVEKSEDSGGFSLLEEGTYTFKLKDVTAGETQKGDPKWVFKWEAQLENGGTKAVQEHCALTEASLWKLKSIFKAFGVSTDTDTDDLVGKTVQVDVEHRVQQGAGKYAGTLQHNFTYQPAAVQQADPAADDSDEIPY